MESTDVEPPGYVRWRALGTRFIQVVPEVQIHTAQDNHDGPRHGAYCAERGG
ncbi:hypothetical protein O5173_25710 [Escherichia coli]|nr:hypothetical protein [Escherichia coli]